MRWKKKNLNKMGIKIQYMFPQKTKQKKPEEMEAIFSSKTTTPARPPK